MHPLFEGRHVICERAVTPSLLATLFPASGLSWHSRIFPIQLFGSQRQDQRLQGLIPLAR